MSKLKATRSIDHTSRGYHMDIEPGGLYEIWLPFDEHPKLAVTISCITERRAANKIWEVLVNGQVITQRSDRIFRIGSAKPPPNSTEETMSAMQEEIQRMEDQKILKLLSEMT